MFSDGVNLEYYIQRQSELFLRFMYPTLLKSLKRIMTWTTCVDYREAQSRFDTHLYPSVDDVDYLLLYSPGGQTGETVFTFASAPTVSAPPNVFSNFTDGSLILHYTLTGIQFVTIVSTGNKINLLIMDKLTAYTWHAPIIAESGAFGNFYSIGTNTTVLVGGPYVLRNASISGNTLSLVSTVTSVSEARDFDKTSKFGDLNGTTTIEFIAPINVTALKWNGIVHDLITTPHGSLSARVNGAGQSPALPTLQNWRVMGRCVFDFSQH